MLLQKCQLSDTNDVLIDLMTVFYLTLSSLSFWAWCFIIAVTNIKSQMSNLYYLQGKSDLKNSVIYLK